MKRYDLTLILTIVLDVPLVALGVFVLYQKVSIATTIAFLLVLTGPLATLGFVAKYRRSLKTGNKLQDKYFRKFSLSGNAALALSIVLSYVAYGLTEKSLLLLPIAFIAVINIIVVRKPNTFIGNLSNVS